MFARLATSSVRIASRGTRNAATFTTEGVKGNDFKALRDATKQHAAGELRIRGRKGGQGQGDVQETESKREGEERGMRRRSAGVRGIFSTFG
jgi:hypothetical protein